MSHPLLSYEHSRSLTVESDDVLEEIITYDPHDRVASSLFTKNELEDSLIKEFTELKEDWLYDTMFDSGYNSLVNHPAFLKIISWEETIIPILVEDMLNNGVPWYYALAQITDENPVEEEHSGDHEKVIEDWKRWAEANDFV